MSPSLLPGDPCRLLPIRGPPWPPHETAAALLPPCLVPAVLTLLCFPAQQVPPLDTLYRYLVQIECKLQEARDFILLTTVFPASGTMYDRCLINVEPMYEWMNEFYRWKMKLSKIELEPSSPNSKNIFLLSYALFLVFMVVQKRVNLATLRLLSHKSLACEVGPWLVSGNLEFVRILTIPRSDKNGSLYLRCLYR